MEYLLSLIIFYGVKIKIYKFTVYDFFILSFTVFLLLAGKKIYYRRNLITIFFLVFMLIIYRFITIIINNSHDLTQYLSVGYYVEFLISVILILLLKIDIKKMWNIIFWLVIIDNLIAIIRFIIYHGHIQATGLSGSGFHWMTIPYIVYLVITKEISSKKKFIYEIILLIGLLSTEQRIAWATLLISLFIGFIVLRKDRPILAKNYIFIAIIVITFVFLMPLEAKKVILIRLSQILTKSGTIGYRFALWQTSVQAFLYKPIFGIGSGGFSRISNDIVLNSPLYENPSLQGLSTHNNFLEALSETGILGTVIYYSTVFYILLYSKKVTKIVKDDFIIITCYICLISYTILDFFGQGTFYPFFTYLFMIISYAGKSIKYSLPEANDV